MDTIFYDIETDSKWASYAHLHMIGIQINDQLPQIVDLNSPTDIRELQGILESPDWIKVGFNCINYDDIVMHRHGLCVNSINRHDLFLIAKTINPMLPAYGLKFLNWYWFRDPHEPERRLHAWCQHHRCTMYQAPQELLSAYCLHDIVQTARLWRLLWPIVQQPRHWRAYSELELPMGDVIREIMLQGHECITLDTIRLEMFKIRSKMVALNLDAKELTEGIVTNLGSSQQVAKELKFIEDFELQYTEHGNLQLRKDELLTMLDLDDPSNDQSRLARLTYEYRQASKQLGYLNAYRRSLLFELRTCAKRRDYRRLGYAFIPKSFSTSTARSRRILSSSYFGINFQNQTTSSKQIQLVPPGWIGFWLDATQIENVAHIYYSRDSVRRKAYISDINWNEYVWLANTVLGLNLSRQELDRRPSSANPTWSIYKQFKTCKLALNFFMGIAKFAQTNRLSASTAKQLFEQIHRACPAIRRLLHIVEQEIMTKGYIQDPWGHIYTGDTSKIYKIVTYLIQGTGTGSVPKAQARAIYDVLHRLPPLDTVSNCPSAVLTTLIHDEIGFRLHSSLGCQQILSTIHDCLYCMEEQFSSMFDHIPLRAKLKVSITTAADAIEIDHHQLSRMKFDEKISSYI